MSREVRHDGLGAFHVRFPFDRQLVDLIKTLPNRRWNAADRHWWQSYASFAEAVIDQDLISHPLYVA